MPHLQLRPEEEAILLCSYFRRTGQQEATLLGLVGDDGFVWPDFWAEADEQQILPLVTQTLTESILADVIPKAVVDDARALRMRLSVHCLSLHGELQRIGKRLQARGIPVVPLKGTELSARLYGAIDSRRPGDIDILIPREHLEEARAILRSCGYTPAANVKHGVESHSFHGVPWVREDANMSYVLELHWGLNDPRFVTVDYEAMWRRILDRGVDTRGFNQLPDEELLVFLGMHLAKHDVGLVRLLGDVDRLVRRTNSPLDWLHVLSLAERWSAAGLLYFSLERASQLLDTPVPPWVLLRLRPSAWSRHLVAALAGPARVLRPPSMTHLRNNSFRLAYCAMLTPTTRGLEAFWSYFFGPQHRPARGPVGAVAANVQRVGRGVAWTLLVTASAFVPWPAVHPPSARKSPST